MASALAAPNFTQELSRRRGHERRTLFALTGAWLAGGAAGVVFGRSVIPGAVTIASFLLLGGLTAIDRRLTPGVVTLMAVMIGLLHGWLNGAGIAEAEREALCLAGIASAIFVVVSIAAAFVILFQAVAADITKSKDCAAMVEAARDRFGRLDFLDNNVGIGSRGSVVDETEKNWRRVMQVNVETMFLAAKHAIPAMVKAGGGAIVNVSSISALSSPINA